MLPQDIQVELLVGREIFGYMGSWNGSKKPPPLPLAKVGGRHMSVATCRLAALLWSTFFFASPATC